MFERTAQVESPRNGGMSTSFQIGGGKKVFDATGELYSSGPWAVDKDYRDSDGAAPSEWQTTYQNPIASYLPAKHPGEKGVRRLVPKWEHETYGHQINLKSQMEGYRSQLFRLGKVGKDLSKSPRLENKRRRAAARLSLDGWAQCKKIGNLHIETQPMKS